MSRDSSVGIVTGYGLDAEVQFPAGAIHFSLFHNVKTDSVVQPASYPICTGISFPGAKRPGREADYSYPSSAEVKNGEAVPSLADTS
jgi:hypothetical protein